MNNLTFTSLSNAPLYPVCYYISAFSTFFTSNDLMNIKEENQSLSVINALFEYFNASKNESLAKNQFLQKVLIKGNYQEGEDMTLDMKYVDETYQYIINVGLFDYYGNITGYLSRIRKRAGNRSLSEFKQTVLEDLSEGYICSNLCSSKFGSTKLSLFTITKLIDDYIWPYFLQRQKGITNDKTVKLIQRFKRQPPEYINTNNGTQSENVSELNLQIDDAAILEALEDSVERSNIINYLQNYLNSVEEDSVERSNIINYLQNYLNSVEEGKHIISEDVKDLGSSENENEHNISLKSQPQESLEMPKELQVSAGASAITNKRKNLNPDIDSSPAKILRVSTENNSSLIPVDLVDKDLALDDTPGTSQQSRISTLYRYPKSKQMEPIRTNVGNIEEIHSNSSNIKTRNGVSKRMLFIERAAKHLNACKPEYDFNESVNILKGFLLKLEESDSDVPTYEKLVKDFCNNSHIPPDYNIYSIPNDKFIDDVLFESYFGHMSTFDDLMLYSGNIYQNFHESVKSYLRIYENSSELKESLRVEDFLLLKLNFQNKSDFLLGRKENARKRITAALYRLALRECEENWTESSIVLYGITLDNNFSDIKYNSSAINDYMFRKFTEFFTNRQKAEVKLNEISIRKKNAVIFEMELENQGGIANIDRIIQDDTTGRYMIAPNAIFPIKMIRNVTIGVRKLFSVELQDRRPKEEKMIDLVYELYNLLKEKFLFVHYYKSIKP